MHAINRIIVDEAIRIMVTKSRYEGLKSGFTTLDYLIHGFAKGRLIVLGGRPGMGKTTFACSIVDNVCIKEKKSCVYFSPKDSKESLVQRLIRIHGDIESNDKDINRISDSASDIVDSPLWIDDSPAIYVDKLMQECREIRKEREIDLIVVDDLQLLSDSSNREKDTICKLKGLAEELQSPILLLSNLNVSAEKRPNHYPGIADFPEHEVLGRYADVLLLLYRDFYYSMNEAQRDQATIEVARSKHNSGISTPLVFNPDIPKFQDRFTNS